MAKNDTIIIDGILDERVALNYPSSKRDEVFEYFSIEQILKDANLSKDEILIGRVDGKNDGGIDGFYIFVNGHLLTDADNFFWPKTNVELDVHIITCKHHDTFKQAPLDNITATLSEILDFSIEKKDLNGSYNNELLKCRELLKTAYRKLASKLTLFSIKLSYASRGDTSMLGESLVSRGNQIKKIAKELFGSQITQVSFFGSTELVELSRKTPNFTLELPFISNLGRGERYVLLCRLVDYYSFICDESKKLRRYLFDSNVRDFMGLNRVNEDIKATLENAESPDFWWLNNGITILANSAKIVGSSILVGDIQIVNGLQSTESIYKYFSNGNCDPNERAVLVKIIVTIEPEIRDSIIRATNNQTIVELSALRATDKIQRDIEDVLLKHSIYYERRTNYYINQGAKLSEIVTPLYLASGYLSLILKQPEIASQLKSKFMRNPDAYEKIFSEDARLDVWPSIAKILKKTDLVLELIRPSKNSNTENFLKRWRHVLSYLTIARLLGTFHFNINDLVNFDIDRFSEKEIMETWDFLIPSENSNKLKSRWISKNKILETFKEASTKYNIGGLKEYSKYVRWNIHLNTKSYLYKKTNKAVMTSEFIDKVHAKLPRQPWKPGTHLLVAKELKCTKQEIYDAVEALIGDGRRYKQKDGIVYDKDGNVLEIDLDRVDKNTLQLKKDAI